MEFDLAELFKGGAKPNPHFEGNSLIPSDLPAELNEGQRQAVLTSLAHTIVVITGGAGAGKTYSIRTLCDFYERAGKSVQLCAPTGKAAKRMEESTGRPAMTIHRLLEYNGREFQVEGPIDTDLLIADECFDYKQPILTEEGWRYIGEIVNSQSPIRVWSRNPVDGCLELKPIVRWLKHPAPEKLLKICAGRSSSMRSARIIRCTPDHKILTPYGYRRASDLRVGEEVIAKGFQFTPEQRAIMVGSLLGDGSLNREGQRKSPQVVLMQGEDQRDYLEFKRHAFGLLAGQIQQGQSGYADKAVWRLGINVIDDTYEIAREIVTNGDHASGRRRWTPTNRFLKWIDELALTIWFLDNGSLNSRLLSDGSTSHYASLHTQRFSEEDNQRFADTLKNRFGLTVTVAPDSKGYFFLRFNKENTDKLLSIIRPFTPPSMSYKTGVECDYNYEPLQQPETCISRIQSIEETKPTVSFVYDIEVAEHHNYIAGNIIVSNCSMIDVPLFWHLLRAVDLSKTAVVLVGDHNQLPPVGPGNVLRDLLATRAVPYVVLGQVVRQAGILKENCAAVLKGAVAPSSPVQPDGLRAWYRFTELSDGDDLLGFIRALYQTKLSDDLHLDLIHDVQLLSPTRKGPLGVNALNLELQRLIQKKLYGVDVPLEKGLARARPLLHDKVIQRRNNYSLGIMNGAVGQVVGVERKTGDLTVRFDGHDVTIKKSEGHLGDIDLAYCLTIHQVQGSEFPVALVVCHKSHSFQHHRNLLYTGVTRAKRAAVILGDAWGVRNCAARVETNKRRTWLALIGGRS